MKVLWVIPKGEMKNIYEIHVLKVIWVYIWVHTPKLTANAPEHRHLEIEIPIQNPPFSGSILVFGSVSLIIWSVPEFLWPSSACKTELLVKIQGCFDPRIYAQVFHAWTWQSAYLTWKNSGLQYSKMTSHISNCGCRFVSKNFFKQDPLNEPRTKIWVSNSSMATLLRESGGKVLLMEEILHHLRCTKPRKYWGKLPINWCRISPINGTIEFLMDNQSDNCFTFLILHQALQVLLHLLPRFRALGMVVVSNGRKKPFPGNEQVSSLHPEKWMLGRRYIVSFWKTPLF